MSFNRGSNRDSFGNHGFNRNAGNTGGGVNPWEGGMMPGRGILPTPNNNLALASPHAQLAIASNLLSNLLRSQQEVQPQVPSLLSLGNNFGGPGPNFRGQQPFGPGRFDNRRVRRQGENRRSEPYKMGPRARDGTGGRRGPSAQQSRAAQSGNQRINGNQIQHRHDKSSKAISASKHNQATVKKEPQDVKTSDNEKADTSDLKSEDIDEIENKKRDWKDEKKEEVNLSNKSENVIDSSKEDNVTLSENTAGSKEASKDGDAANAASDKDGKTTGEKSKARHAESRYADVPMNRMFCHVCNKHMWDGYSFENHLRGRAHQLMMDKLDESYKLKVDLMRHELRVAEEQRELSLNNSKRRGKQVSVDLNVREYCTMCDLNFYGTLSIHRKSEKHQQLKTFLHPRCTECSKEFPSRIEYDEHCLMPVHMKAIVQAEEQRKYKRRDKLGEGEAEVRTAEDEEKEVSNADLKDDKEEELPKSTQFITDFGADLNNPKHQIPSFKYCITNQIPIGKSMVKEVSGYYCEKCRRFMITADDMNAHLKGITHYRNFVQEIESQMAKSAMETSKSTEEAEGDAKTQKDNEECEGNWKRRKVTHSEDEDGSDPKKTNEANDNETFCPTKSADGDKKYDPLEADAESDEETEQSEEKKSSSEKMWPDMDTDIDIGIGNLLEEDNAEDKIQVLDNLQTPPKLDKEIVQSTKPVNNPPPRGGRSGYRQRGNRARRSRR